MSHNIMMLLAFGSYFWLFWILETLCQNIENVDLNAQLPLIKNQKMG